MNSKQVLEWINFIIFACLTLVAGFLLYRQMFFEGVIVYLALSQYITFTKIDNIEEKLRSM